jgi:hypothetical protein
MGSVSGTFAAVFVLATVSAAPIAFAKNAIQKECSEKYQAAKAANQLGGKTYNQFYKECAAAVRAGGAPEAAPAAAPAAPAPAPAPAPTVTTTAPMAPRSGGAAVFPNAISPEFSKETAGKARMHTCLAQYKANKATNGNGGLKWIEKGGGYYSECNKRLKG